MLNWRGSSRISTYFSQEGESFRGGGYMVFAKLYTPEQDPSLLYFITKLCGNLSSWSFQVILFPVSFHIKTLKLTVEKVAIHFQLVSYRNRINEFLLRTESRETAISLDSADQSKEDKKLEQEEENQAGLAPPFQFPSKTNCSQPMKA